MSVVLLFAFGMLFMLLYYKMFHVSKLGTQGDERFQANSSKSTNESVEKAKQCGNSNQAGKNKIRTKTDFWGSLFFTIFQSSIVHSILL